MVPAVWHIAIAEYVEVVLLHFLAAARDGTVGDACLDSSIVGGGRRYLYLCHLALTAN